MAKVAEQHKTGQTFTVTGRQLTVSDPCYGTDVWCMGEIDNVMPGKWRARALHTDDGAVAALLVHHEAYDIAALENSEVNDADGDFGVDSAQFGFFDSAKYPTDGFPGDTYEVIWEMTRCEGGGFGIHNEIGAVAASGYGDGSYPVVTFNCDDQTVGAMVIFVVEGDSPEFLGDVYSPTAVALSYLTELL